MLRWIHRGISLKSLLLYGLFVLWTCHVGIAHGSDLDGDVQTIKALVEKAHQCVPAISADGVVFCTGVKLDSRELERVLKLDRLSCFSEIKKYKYHIAENTNNGVVPESDWTEFTQSTKRALTFHDFKVVAFKSGTNHVDCIHELLHVYQWDSALTNPLAPPKRITRLKQLANKLDTEVERIAVLERMGKKDQARKLGSKLQTKLDVVSNFSKLVDSLDETEVYYFLYKHCSALKCTEEDIEITLANLDKRKTFLPTSISKELQNEVSQRTRAKFALHSKKSIAEWKPFTDSEINLVSLLLSKEWSQLLETISQEGVKVIGLKQPDNTPLLIDGAIIPESVFNDLPPPNDDLRRSLDGSKILTNQALGKFFCQTTPPVIVITDRATKGTLVHEYLHFLQNKKNSSYCAAVTQQPEVAARFARGEIDMATYESTVIRYQVTNALAERDVYSILEKWGGTTLGRLERLNNQELLKKYEQILDVEN